LESFLQITALDHEVLDDAVELAALVAAGYKSVALWSVLSAWEFKFKKKNYMQNWV